jgi:predicted AlkP superfamily pyrophosphatase or phosphodiesterase
MPNLSRFAGDGIFFESHHPVFPSVTRINAASMVTGRYPGGHGLAANTMMARDYDPNLVFSALEPTLADMNRKTGRVLLAPTLADILSGHGLEYTAIGVGTSGNAYVHNPNADTSGGATIHPDFTLPYSLQDRLASRFGEWPDESQPNTPRFRHAIRILTEHIIPEREPAVALIWSSEPDKAQHAYGVGSEMSDRAVREADTGFGQIMNWLGANGLSETDVMVVSDHGYSTIREAVDVESHIRDAGFSERDALVAPNGGSVLFYTRNQVTASRLAVFLIAQPWCGTLLASEAAGEVEGVLPMALAGCDGPRAPEIAMSFAWDSEANDAGYDGYAYSSGGVGGQGQHGSMSRHEMNNTLLARGPGFKSRRRIASPTGNVDIAPTVLGLLGLPIPEDMDGRVIGESLVGGPDSVESTTDAHLAGREVLNGVYRQGVTLSRVGSTVYLDEGRGWRE